MRTLVTLALSLLFAASATAQSDPCSCYKFPYRFCTPNGLVTWCTDNPWGPDVPPGAIAPERAPSIMGCFEMGNMYQTGWVNNGSGVSLPGLDPDVDPSGNYTYSLGDLFQPVYAGSTDNQMESMWESFLRACNFPIQNLDKSCCLQVTFEGDPTWWENTWVGPHLKNGTLQLTAIYGMVSPPLDNNCQTKCDESGPDTAHMIFINVTPIFLTDNPDAQYLPSVLTRGFVNTVGRTFSKPFFGQVGPNIDDTIADSVTIEQPVDFVTTVMHEMGHWLGLPERFEKCANVSSGNGSCDDDPNSIMWHLDPGQRKWDPSTGPDPSGHGTGDCCWLDKLYFPSTIEPCSSDGVEETPELKLDLEQSEPNPNSGVADIGFSLNHREFVVMTLYNILGKKVASILEKRMMDAGHHFVMVNTSNLASGKYIYVLQAEGQVLSKEMTILK